jgi:hypothetical protein
MTRFRPVSMVAVCASVLILTSHSAIAGTQRASAVTIDDIGMSASGPLGSARNSGDTRQAIGCYTAADAGSDSVGLCQAVDANGVGRQCFTYDPQVLATIRSLNGDSYLLFYWNSDGSCSGVSVSNRSDYQPK